VYVGPRHYYWHHGHRVYYRHPVYR
jgi:hypothetical protein